jgi:hypothetical protein
VQVVVRVGASVVSGQVTVGRTEPEKADSVMPTPVTVTLPVLVTRKE